MDAILEEFDEYLALERDRSDHTRRAYLGELEQRARDLEDSREEEARRDEHPEQRRSNSQQGHDSAGHEGTVPAVPHMPKQERIERPQVVSIRVGRRRPPLLNHRFTELVG